MRTAHRIEPMTAEAFLAFEWASPVKHEYEQGHVHARTGVTKVHARIVRELGAALRSRLMPPCEVFFGDVLVQADWAQAFYYPDLVVTGDARDAHPRIVQFPRLVVEVLSETTRDHDRRTKRQAYARIDSVAHILLVDSERRAVEWDRRQGDGWVRETVEGSGELVLDDLGITLSLDEIYASTDLPR